MRPQLGGLVAPAVLAVLVVVAGTLAVVGADDPPPPTAPTAPLTTPLLSARRVPALLANEIAADRLAVQLDSFWADTAWGGAGQSSCLVVHSDGTPVYRQRETLPLIPASNLKLLTALAALDRLGPTMRYETEVRASSSPVGGVLRGPVFLIGNGDPLLATTDYAASLPNQPQVFTSFERLAQGIIDAGVREVAGGIVGDATRYDAQRYIPSWKPGYAAEGQVGPMSALVLNDGWAEYRGRRLAAADPAQHAAAALTTMLRVRGVAVTTPPSSGVAADGGAVVAAISSPPLGEIVGEMLRESDNNTAELLTKELAALTPSGYLNGGTTAAGLTATRAALEARHLPLKDWTAIDGSGLDRGNRATCRLLMGVLDQAGSSGSIFDGLAVAGRTGNLSKRFIGNPAEGRLRAKTGALTGVVALGGWMLPPVGGAHQPLAFSMIANDVPGDATGRALQERLGAVLARYPEAPAVAALGPL